MHVKRESRVTVTVTIAGKRRDLLVNFDVTDQRSI